MILYPFTSYKVEIGSELLDWLTLYAISSQSEVLHDKVSASLEVACSIRFVDRQTMFNDMRLTGVLLEIVGRQTDILDTVGAKELIASSCSALAMKSVCNFVVLWSFHRHIVKGNQDRTGLRAHALRGHGGLPSFVLG